MLTAEQLAFRKKWVAALRSGKYKQTHSFLHRRRSFCCLGVMCDLKDSGRWRSYDFGLIAYGNETSHPPADVLATYGFANDDALQLAYMNDGVEGFTRHTFAEIADTIELLTLADMETP